MANMYEAIQKFTMEVNNKLEDFIVKEVNNATGDIGIVINAQKIAEAVQKQIPKKPDYEGDGYADGFMVYDTWICPTCGQRYEVDHDNYK